MFMLLWQSYQGRWPETFQAIHFIREKRIWLFYNVTFIPDTSNVKGQLVSHMKSVRAVHLPTQGSNLYYDNAFLLSQKIDRRGGGL